MSHLEPVDRLFGQPEIFRRERIFNAAQSCFVRSGFHRATMQEVADEAEMSAGNLYRTFQSKEEIVVGLCERDQAAMVADFSQLSDSNGLISAMYGMLAKHLLHNPRERYIVMLEIWAQSTRNPALAQMRSHNEAIVHSHVFQMLERGQARGKIAPDVDLHFAVKVIFTLVTGLFRRRAHEDDFDAINELAMAIGVIAKVLDGTVKPLKFDPAEPK